MGNSDKDRSVKYYDISSIVNNLPCESAFIIKMCGNETFHIYRDEYLNQKRYVGNTWEKALEQGKILEITEEQVAIWILTGIIPKLDTSTEQN